MPPSGYSHRQTSAISLFFQSCAEDLEREAVAAGRTPIQALEKECDDIDGAIAGTVFSPFACDVMRITRAFYARVAIMGPSDFDAFRACLPDAIETFSDELRAVHIPN